MAACTPGIKAVALCQLGDESIEEATGKIYNGKGKDGKKIDKGIAFPTCISPNHCVGHYSPLVRSPAPRSDRRGCSYLAGERFGCTRASRECRDAGAARCPRACGGAQVWGFGVVSMACCCGGAGE